MRGTSDSFVRPTLGDLADYDKYNVILISKDRTHIEIYHLRYTAICYARLPHRRQNVHAVFRRWVLPIWCRISFFCFNFAKFEFVERKMLKKYSEKKCCTSGGENNGKFRARLTGSHGTCKQCRSSLLNNGVRIGCRRGPFGRKQKRVLASCELYMFCLFYNTHTISAYENTDNSRSLAQTCS